MPLENCGSCKYAIIRDVSSILCCRYPPLPMTASGHSGFPSTTFTAWCGEYVVAPPPAPAPPPLPPVNVDVPYVSQDGDTLNCTMGNWEGEPTSYAYQWKRDATNVGTNQSAYTVGAMDAGRTLTCVVTATNAGGSATAPPSNGVAIPAAARATRE